MNIAEFHNLQSHLPRKGRQFASQVSAAATENVLTITPAEDEIVVIAEILAGYDSDVTDGVLTVEWDEEVRLSIPVIRGGPLPLYFYTAITPEIANMPVIIRMTAGSSGITSSINVIHF